MADDKKVKKTKKKKEEESVPTASKEAEGAEEPAEVVLPATPPKVQVVSEDKSGPTKNLSKGSRKARRTGSNVYALFSEKTVAEFKEAFHMIDVDKDGIISQNDLRAAFDRVGKTTNENELTQMLNESPGPLNFTAFLTIFGNKLCNNLDDPDTINNCVMCYDKHGKIDAEKLRVELMTSGDVFSEDEVNQAYDYLPIDGQGRIDTAQLINLLTGGDDEEDDE